MFRNKWSLKHTWSNTQSRSFSECQLTTGSSITQWYDTLRKRRCPNSPCYLTKRLYKTSSLLWGSSAGVYGPSGPSLSLHYCHFTGNVLTSPTARLLWRSRSQKCLPFLRRKKIEAQRDFSLSLLEHPINYNKTLCFLTARLLSPVLREHSLAHLYMK